MPSLKTAHGMGRAVLAGLLGLCATGALAGSNPELVVSERPDPDTRAVQIKLSDINLTDAYGQRTLAIRLDRATRQVCDMLPGSALNTLPSAKACLEEARAGALAQLEARGVPTATLAAAGGMP